MIWRRRGDLQERHCSKCCCSIFSLNSKIQNSETGDWRAAPWSVVSIDFIQFILQKKSNESIHLFRSVRSLRSPLFTTVRSVRSRTHHHSGVTTENWRRLTDRLTHLFFLLFFVLPSSISICAGSCRPHHTSYQQYQPISLP
jgi:hypothetical protein